MESASLWGVSDRLERMETARRESLSRLASEKAGDSSIIADIHTQLDDTAPDPLTRALGNKAAAEHRANATYDAKAETVKRRATAAESLTRAKAHIERLKQAQSGKQEEQE